MVSYQDTSDGVFSDTTIENMIIAKATDDAHRLKADNLKVDVTIANDATLDVRTIQIDLEYDLEFAIPLWDAQLFTLTENRNFYVPRSEENTSELQYLMRISYAVSRLK